MINERTNRFQAQEIKSTKALDRVGNERPRASISNERRGSIHSNFPGQRSPFGQHQTLQNQTLQNLLIQLIVQLLLRVLEELKTGIDQKPEEPYRSIDGSNNNPFRPELGKAEKPLTRTMPQDSSREPGGASEVQLPSARAISNAVFQQNEDTENSKGLSDMFWLWGQFLDHDIDLTHTDSADAADIAMPKGDPHFDPDSSGDETMSFDRSVFTTDAQGQRQQISAITPFIDASNVYGSDTDTADLLRSFEGGKLKTSDGNLMPLDDKQFYMAGDIRANEHLGLTAMQTLWMREHNRIADELTTEYPDWDDETLYQEARKKVGAEIQAISYNEFLPQLLGEGTLDPYSGYDPFVDPRIANSFAGAAFRFGHSMVSPNILAVDDDGVANEIPLRDGFFQPKQFSEIGVDALMRGFSTNPAQGLDGMLVDDLRNFLFGEPGHGGFDLASLNIQRGRDHALPSYNDARESLGLERITHFDDPVFAGDSGERMASVYDSTDDIDLWVGGLAEQKSGDGMVGETYASIIKDQFERTRNGDHFWYENIYSGDELEALNSLKLSEVIRRNTDVGEIQDDVMYAPEEEKQSNEESE